MTAWSISRPAIGARLRAMRLNARAPSASGRQGIRAEPGADRASTSDGLSTSHAVGPRRSLHPVSATQRMRTAPTGGGGCARRPPATLPNSPRWTWTMRSPNVAKRCLPWAVTSSSTRPSTSAASAKRPWGLDTATGRPAKRASLARAPGGAACGLRASETRPRCRRGPAGRRRRRTCRRLDDDGVGVPEPGVERRRGGDDMAARARARRATSAGAWPSIDDRRRAAAGPRVEPGPRAPQRPAGRRRRRRPRRLPAPNRRAASWSRICGWASPPIVPNTAASAPSRVRHRRAQRVRRPPPRPELGRMPGLQAEAEAAVVQVDPGRRLDEPRPEARGVGLDQADGEAGGVGGAQVRRVAGVRGHRAAAGPLEVEQVGPRPWIASSSAAPSASSWSTSGRSKPAVAAASTRRWAHAASSGSSGSPTASASASGAEEQVALRVRADRVQLDAERVEPAAARPSRPGR